MRIIIGLIAAALFINVLLMFQTEQIKKDKMAYAAWVKLTENPKQLSYDEWKALRDQNALPTTK